MPLKPHPNDPDKMVYVSRQYDIPQPQGIPQLQGVTTAQPEQEPVAWRYRGNLHEFDPSDWAEGPVTPLYTTPPQRTEQNFCPRCGKRTKDIHTCTPPPQENA